MKIHSFCTISYMCIHYLRLGTWMLSIHKGGVWVRSALLSLYEVGYSAARCRMLSPYWSSSCCTLWTALSLAKRYSHHQVRTAWYDTLMAGCLPTRALCNVYAEEKSFHGDSFSISPYWYCSWMAVILELLWLDSPASPRYVSHHDRMTCVDTLMGGLLAASAFFIWYQDVCAL